VVITVAVDTRKGRQIRKEKETKETKEKQIKETDLHVVFDTDVEMILSITYWHTINSCRECYISHKEAVRI
jgi:hypothetical protein